MRSTDRNETRIDAKLVLRVFQRVCDRGRRAEAGAYDYQGLRALDLDGYSASLSDGTVTVSILFHSRIALDTPNRRALSRFRRRLMEVDAETAGAGG